MVTVSIDHVLPGGAPAARREVVVAAITGPAGAALADRVVGQVTKERLDADGHATIDLEPLDVGGQPIIWQVRVGSVTRHLDLSDAGSAVSWADPSVLVLAPPAPTDWVPVALGLSSADALALGVAGAPGTAGTAARADHVHPRPTAAQVGADPAGTAAALIDDLSGVSNPSAARTNLGLGSAASQPSAAFATAAQGALADSAVQPARTINGAPLSANVVLDHDDVGADEAGAALAAVAALPEWAPGIGTSLDESTPGFVAVDSTVTSLAFSPGVVNSTAEGSMLAATVPVDDLQLDTTLLLIIGGTFTNNTGANRNATVRVKFGGLTTATFAFTAIPTSATGRYWMATVEVTAIDYFGLRLIGIGRCSMSAAGAGLDFGAITTNAGSLATFTAGDTIAVDVTAQLSVASASLSAAVASGAIRRSRG